MFRLGSREPESRVGGIRYQIVIKVNKYRILCISLRSFEYCEKEYTIFCFISIGTVQEIVQVESGVSKFEIHLLILWDAKRILFYKKLKEKADYFCCRILSWSLENQTYIAISESPSELYRRDLFLLKETRLKERIENTS